MVEANIKRIAVHSFDNSSSRNIIGNHNIDALSIPTGKKLALYACMLFAACGISMSGCSSAGGGAGDRNCSDFNSQREAQIFFDGNGSSDPHNLDADNDGIACEHLRQNPFEVVKEPAET